MPSFSRNVSGGTSVASWKQPQRKRNNTNQVSSYWTAGVLDINIEYLIIAGGGGSLSSGGGAGGYRTSVSFPVTVGTTYTVTVGAGGPYHGYIGYDSVFSTVTSTGGGPGSGANIDGRLGGSGSGGTTYNGGGFHPGGISSPVTSPAQGNTGGDAINGETGWWISGGGGGAGGVGGTTTFYTGGVGGSGASSSITGSAVTRGGGGGGTANNSGRVGGSGGGGNAEMGATPAQNGTANTGGGGGGIWGIGAVGAGGSGVVILAYPTSESAASATTGSPTYSSASRAGYHVYTFTGTGSITF